MRQPGSWKKADIGRCRVSAVFRLISTRPASGCCFQSLGAEPRLRATLVSESSLRYLGWALALLVGLIGLALTDRPVRTKAIYVIESLVLALILPLLVGWILQLEITEVFEPRVLHGLPVDPLLSVRGLCDVAGAEAGRTTLAATGSRGCDVAGDAADFSHLRSGYCGAGLEQDSGNAEPGSAHSITQRRRSNPYDPADLVGTTSAAKVLVPYAKYVELWNAAYPDQQLEARRPPAAYALAGATYQATLADEQDLLITGKIVIDSFVDDAVTVPLGIVGGVLTQATLDGQPARLHILQPTAPPPAPPPSPEQQAAAQQVTSPVAPPEPSSLVALQLSGKGRKQLELTVRMRLERSGGWRIARGRLPAAPSTRLDLTVPLAQTDVRLSEVPDRELHETTQPSERLETTLGAEGQFVLQWRAKVAVGQIDERLTVQSSALFDVQEDGLRLTWQLAMEFPGSQRDTFTLKIPADYLLENVFRRQRSRMARAARQRRSASGRDAAESGGRPRVVCAAPGPLRRHRPGCR